MSKIAEKLYDLCLQIAASRYYEIDANEVQSVVLEGSALDFESATKTVWPLYEVDGDCRFWFTIAPDYSGILHADDLLGLMSIINEFEQVYCG